MAEMVFFEKPGCINGGKQKKILENAGNSVTCIDILSYNWSKDKILPFIENKEPTTMMNYTAPAIKNGEIVPENLTIEEAVSLMVENPLLIKRPLIKVDGLYIQGFTDERLVPYLGDWDGEEDVITCPNLKTVSCDEKKAK